MSHLISIRKHFPYIKHPINNYFFATLMVLLSTLISLCMPHSIHDSNLIMLYLLGVMIIATKCTDQQGPAIFAALLSTIMFDFFFVPPYYSFAVSDIQYSFTLIVMLIVTQTISHLTVRIHKSVIAEKNAKYQAETERLRNILLTSISHDLRTPLTVIMGSASSILATSDELSRSEQHDLLQSIVDESKRLNHLVNNVLQIIRLEAGAIKITKQVYDFIDILTTSIQLLESAITNKKLSIKFNMPTTLPLVSIDPILIEQVLINLLDNAIKQSHENSYIKISVESIDQKIKVSIFDRGPGIPENECDRIFEKFYQGNHDKTNQSGFGLGLAICKNIIKAHNGDIWAQNRDGGGAMFCFTLPIG